MSDQVLNVEWRHVLSPKDGVGQIGFTDTATGHVIRLNMPVESMESVVGGVTDFVTPNPDSLRGFLERIGQLQKSC